MEERFLLTKEELLELLKDRLELSRLEAAGVDNWSGYDYVDEVFYEEGETEESVLKEMLDSYKKIS